MSQITASCPECQAQYQLTPEQLSIAGGKVRCGACMTVFQASPAPVKSTPPPVAAPSSRAAADRAQRSSFINDSDEKLMGGSKKREVNDDLIMDGDDEETGLIMKSGQGQVEFSDEFENVLREDGLIGNNGNLTDDEAWAEQLLEDIEEAEPTIGAFGKKSDAPKKDADPFAADLEGLDISLELTADEEEALGAFTKDELRHRIKPEPLEFAMASKRSLWVNLALSLVAIVAIAGIAAQLLYFQFDSLARDPQWRQSYALICEKLGCTLPDQFRLEDIQASHLAVKTHPYYTKSLIVDVIITNHADIAQPFPNIELFFTNTEDKVIAARKFAPTDYLRGELQHARLMTQRQPVHIAIEIDDPGRLASGYRMQLSY